VLRTTAISHALHPRLEAVEKAEGAQVCFLNDILRVIFIARQPAREVVADFKCGRIVSSKSVSLAIHPFGTLRASRSVRSE